MSTIGRVGTSHADFVIFEDSVTAAAVAQLQTASEQREAARQERAAASEERQRLLQQAVENERTAALASFIGGVARAAGQAAQGITGLIAVGREVEAVSHEAREADATRMAEQAANRQQGNVQTPGTGRTEVSQAQFEERQHYQQTASEARSNAARCRIDAERLRNYGRLGEATGNALGSVFDGWSSSENIGAKDRQRIAERAQERADNARDMVQAANELASRAISRAEESLRLRAQRAEQLIERMPA